MYAIQQYILQIFKNKISRDSIQSKLKSIDFLLLIAYIFLSVPQKSLDNQLNFKEKSFSCDVMFFQSFFFKKVDFYKKFFFLIN
jgi:hypothetical protein